MEKNNLMKLIIFITFLLTSLSCASATGFSAEFSENDSHPSDPENQLDELEAASFHQKCSLLTREIKSLALKQLKLDDCFISDINFLKYEIENWPKFVPFHFKNWDQQAYEDIRRVLPTLQFKKKDNLQDTKEECGKYLKESRRELLNLLLAIFKEQTGSSVKVIKWIGYNLIGWPAGVNLAVDRLNRSEILAVYRCIDTIKFIPLQEGQEKRYVQFTDGAVWEFDGPPPRRREFQKMTEFYRNLDASQKNVQVETSDSEEDEIPIITVEKEKKVTGRKRSLTTAKKCPRFKRTAMKDDLTSESDPETFPFTAEQEFTKKCLQLVHRIKKLAKEQLHLEAAASEINLNAYEIENWPQLVPLKYIDWDELAYTKINEAAPFFLFKAKQKNNSEREAPVLGIIRENRGKLQKYLIEILSEQAGEDYETFKWEKFNLIGWPAGINLSTFRFNKQEILQVFNHLDSIFFQPLNPGQKFRTIQFSDGTCWEIEGRVPDVKEFTTLFRKQQKLNSKSSSSQVIRFVTPKATPKVKPKKSSRKPNPNPKSKSNPKYEYIAPIIDEKDYEPERDNDPEPTTVEQDTQGYTTPQCHSSSGLFCWSPGVFNFDGSDFDFSNGTFA